MVLVESFAAAAAATEEHGCKPSKRAMGHGPWIIGQLFWGNLSISQSEMDEHDAEPALKSTPQKDGPFAEPMARHFS
jgi:hypothetical protein